MVGIAFREGLSTSYGICLPVMVGIAFREGLSTSYGICLPVMQGMKATVGIVTEELRLIERLFQPLREYAEGA